MENQKQKIGDQKRHPFSYTIGEGPYKYVGSFDLGRVIGALHSGNVAAYQNGMAAAPRLESGMGTCSHCGHAILNIQIIRRGDGKLYGVGSDCVLKVAAEGDVSAISVMERAIRDAEKKRRRDKEAAKVADLEPRFQLALSVLSKAPHPNEYFAKQGKTLADYYRYISKNSRNMAAAIKDAAEIMEK